MDNKKIKLELVKDKHGMIASNEDVGVVEYFDESESSRKEFLLYILKEFINKEIK